MRTCFLICLLFFTAVLRVCGQNNLPVLPDSTQTVTLHLYRAGEKHNIAYMVSVNDAKNIGIKPNEDHTVITPAGPTKIGVDRLVNSPASITGRDLNFKAEAGKSYYFKIQRRAIDQEPDSIRRGYSFEIVEVTERMFLKETTQNNH